MATAGHQPALREKLARLAFAALGAVGGAVLAVGVNVASTQINRRFEAAPPPTTDATCSAQFQDGAAGREALDILVTRHNDRCWARSVNLNDEKSFDVQIKYKNNSDAPIEDVTVQSWLPKGVELVAGTTRVRNSTNPEYLVVKGNILDSGINVGNYGDGAVMYLIFTARITAEYDAPCGVGLLGVFARERHPTLHDWIGAGVVTGRDC